MSNQETVEEKPVRGPQVGNAAQTEAQSSATATADSPTAPSIDTLSSPCAGASADAPVASAAHSPCAGAPAAYADEDLLVTAGGHRVPADWLARFVLIWGGYAVSAFAGNAASYAGIWYVTESTGSPLALAALYVLAFLPMGLLSPFGGVLADKDNRKLIIIACDAILALSALAAAAWIVLAGPSFGAVALYCGTWGVVSGFRAPAFNATMPLLVPARHLMRVNTMDTLLGSISMIAAPALGILLYASFGLQASVFLGVVGASAAVVTMLLAKLPRLEPGAQAGVLRSLGEGVSALAEKRGLLILTVGVALGMLAYGPIDSLLPLMVSSHFGGDGFAASLLAAVMGAGMLVGALLLMAVNPTRKLARVIVLASLVVGAAAFASGLIPASGYWWFVGCIGVLAIACAWFNAPLMTLLQNNIGHDKLGRVMGLLTAMNGLAIPVGTALGGVIAELTGTPMFFCIDGAFIIALGLAIALPKSVRQLP